jgi:hypothetical protein
LLLLLDPAADGMAVGIGVASGAVLADGATLGARLVRLGRWDGWAVGAESGWPLGWAVGRSEGWALGWALGAA